MMSWPSAIPDSCSFFSKLPVKKSAAMWHYTAVIIAQTAQQPANKSCWICFPTKLMCWKPEWKRGGLFWFIVGIQIRELVFDGLFGVGYTGKGEAAEFMIPHLKCMWGNHHHHRYYHYKTSEMAPKLNKILKNMQEIYSATMRKTPRFTQNPAQFCSHEKQV